MDNLGTMAATSFIAGAAAKSGARAADILFDFAKDLYSNWELLRNSKKFTDVCIKISQYWREQGITEEQCHALAEKLQLVYIPVAATEEDPDLRNMLAVMAAKASAPGFRLRKIHFGFVDVIKSMDQIDAKVVQWIRQQPAARFSRQAVIDAFKKQGHNEKDIEISLNNLQRLMLITFAKLSTSVSIESHKTYLFDPDSFSLTSFGRAFFDACFV